MECAQIPSKSSSSSEFEEMSFAVDKESTVTHPVSSHVMEEVERACLPEKELSVTRKQDVALPAGVAEDALQEEGGEEEDGKAMKASPSKILTAEEIEQKRQKMLDRITSQCIPNIQKTVVLFQTEPAIDIFKDKDFRNALLFMRNSYVGALKHQQIDIRTVLRNDIAQTFVDTDLCKDFKVILDAFFKFDLLDSDGGVNKKIYNPIHNILTTLFNYTDRSESFCFAVCHCPGLLELLVWFLREKKDSHILKELPKPINRILKACLSTMYNSSRLLVNHQRLLEVGCYEASIPYLDSPDDSLQMSALFCIAYLSDEQKSHVFAAKQEQLKGVVGRLRKALSHKDLIYCGWYAQELIKGISVLARNDANKRLVVECDAFDVLLSAMMRDDIPAEQLESTKTIWMLCFDKDNKMLLSQNTAAMEWLHTVALTGGHPCQKTAKGIMWTVKQTSAYEPGTTIVEPGRHLSQPSDVGHIMISYQWDAQVLMVRIKDILKSRGYKVWMDVEHMQGSTLSAMAEAIEQSSAVIVAMSQRYKDSQNCRVEGEYAFTKGKKIIPVIVQQKYKPDGWLGLILGAKLYYNFCGRDPFDKKIQELMRGLGNLGRRTSLPTPSTATSEVAVKFPSVESAPPQAAGIVRKTDFSDWDTGQVERWMLQHGINKSKVGEIQGKHLAFLQEMKHSAPEFYYKYIRRLLSGRLPIEELDALTNFTEALENL